MTHLGDFTRFRNSRRLSYPAQVLEHQRSEMKFTVTRHEQHCLSVVNSGSAAAHRELSRSPNSLLQKSGCCIAFVLSGTLSPALEPIDVLLLLLPALLSRLLIANLPAYFLQDPFFVLDGQGGGGILILSPIQMNSRSG